MNMSLSTIGGRLLPPLLDHQPADFWAAIRAGHWPENYDKPGSRLNAVIQTAREILELAEAREQTCIGAYKGAWEYLPLACSCGEPIERTVLSTYRRTHSLCEACSLERVRQGEEAKVQGRCAARGEVLLSRYVDCHTKHSIQCHCGNVYAIDPNKHRIGRGCRKCAGNCPDTAKAEYYALIRQLGWRTSPYEGTNNLVHIWCDKGHDYDTKPANVKQQKRCAECYREAIRRDDKQYCTTFGDVRHRLRLLRRCEHDELQTADELRNLARALGYYDSIMAGFKKSLVGGIHEDLDHTIPIVWLSYAPESHLAGWQVENMMVVSATFNNQKSDRLSRDALLQILVNPVMRGIWELCDNAPLHVRAVVEAFLPGDPYEQMAILESGIWDSHGLLKKEKRSRKSEASSRKEL